MILPDNAIARYSANAGPLPIKKLPLLACIHIGSLMNLTIIDVNVVHKAIANEAMSSKQVLQAARVVDESSELFLLRGNEYEYS